VTRLILGDGVRSSLVPTVRSPPVPAADGGESDGSEESETEVAIGAQELAWARNRAASSGQTLGAVITEALSKLRNSEVQLELDEMAADGITAEDLEAIRAARRSYRP